METLEGEGEGRICLRERVFQTGPRIGAPGEVFCVTLGDLNVSAVIEPIVRRRDAESPRTAEEKLS